MNILILDVYPKTPYRISKDQNGAYGTANNYGDGFVSRILRYLVKNSIDFPPLYAVQTCGELVNSGHNVDFSKELDLEKKYDLYILPSSIVCHETEIEYVQILKKNSKNVIVIGPFVTSTPEPYLRAGATIIKGEPEMFFHQFNKTVLDLEKLPNIIDNFPTFSLDELSFPGWEVIFKNYTPIMKFLGNGPAVNINASRGCPYSCFYYCVYPLQQGRKLRLKSPKRLLEEMIHLKETLNVSNFLFRDPVFSIHRQHTVEICKEIIDSKHKFNIGVETHLKNIDHDLAKLLRKAGVKLMYVGIESGDEEVRKDANRASDTNLNQIEKVKFLEKTGIKVKAMYIIGLPTDTDSTYKKTVEFAKKVKSSYAQFSVFTPYPGTPVFREYEKKIIAKKYENFTQWQLVFDHPNFKPIDILNLLNYSYQQYYLNPKWMVHFTLNKIKEAYENLYHRIFGFSR
jgi:radical SAM superfamily enzyme YgiQ (UPF0313 family)